MALILSMMKRLPHLCLIASTALLVSCSEESSEQAARYENRADRYAQEEKFREAVIEYRNAAQTTPDNPTIQWKLAKTASKVGNPSAAFTSLARVVQLDPGHFDAQWSLGGFYLASGQTDEVAKIADILLAARPRHPASYILRAGLALTDGQSTEAIGLLKQAVERDPTMVGPLLTLGNIYFAQHKPKLAAEWYERAVKADPNSADVHIARGEFLFVTGAHEEGQKEFRRAIELSPNEEQIRLVLADRYATLGRREDAEREWTRLVTEMNSSKARKAFVEFKLSVGDIAAAKPLLASVLEANEHDPVGLYLKGRIALSENALLQAVGLFQEAIGLDATLAGPHLYLGLIRSLQGQMESAREELRHASRLRPDHEMAHLALANVYLRQQKPAEAEKEAWHALKLNPASLEAALLYGDALQAQKNWAKAEEVYSALIRNLPGEVVGYLKLAALRKLQARPTEAAQLFSQAVAQAPSDLAILQEYLMALMESKQAKKADSILREHLTKDSNNPHLWRLAGRLYFAQLKADQAENAFLKAVELAPNLPVVHYELGQSYVLRNKLTAAESAFRTALKKDDTNSNAHTALGVILAWQGKGPEAIQHYQKAFYLNPQNLIAANNLASSLTEQEQLDDALSIARLALELAPSNPAIKDTIGWAYYKQGNFIKAYPFLAEASAALPQHSLVRYHHAMALAKIGRQEEALAELKAALSLPGGFPEAERAAQMLASSKVEE